MFLISTDPVIVTVLRMFLASTDPAYRNNVSEMPASSYQMIFLKNRGDIYQDTVLHKTNASASESMAKSFKPRNLG